MTIVKVWMGITVLDTFKLVRRIVFAVESSEHVGLGAKFVPLNTAQLLDVTKISI